ncbi:MAG: hypothetical protein KJO76_08045 [Gammaproteobacteria bacterium]|nr:hypothetical protein [Gammaproteobacteria bacterium]
MSSSAFCQILEFRLPDPSGNILRFSGFRLRRIVARTDGRWFLVPCRGDGAIADLQAGWVAAGGRLLGLRWKTRTGERFECGLLCLQPEEAGWRRLLVRLRVPMSPPFA